VCMIYVVGMCSVYVWFVHDGYSVCVIYVVCMCNLCMTGIVCVYKVVLYSAS
jgi:hypothetical protein